MRIKYAVVYSIALAVASIGVPSMLTSSANARELRRDVVRSDKVKIDTGKYKLQQTKPKAKCCAAIGGTCVAWNC